MAVDFAVDVITSAGEQKIAQATAGNRLVYTRVLSSASAYEAAAASSLAPSDLAGPAGTVKAASATDNRARVVGAISSAEGPATLKTFALCGRLETDEEDAVLVVKSDPEIAIPLPGPTAPSTAIEIDFVTEISQAADVIVQITGPGSVTLADLDRFVSMHKAGDTDAGENQSIRGVKRFMDACQSAEFRVAIPGGLGQIAWITGDWDTDASRAVVDFKLRTPGTSDPATVMQLNTRYGNPDVYFPGEVAIREDLDIFGALSVSGGMQCSGRNFYLSNGAQATNGYTLIRSGTSSVPGFYVTAKAPGDASETALISATGGATPTVHVPDLNVQGNAYLHGVLEVNQTSLLKADVSILGALSVTGAFVNGSLWGSGAGALVVAHLSGTTATQVSDYINVQRGRQIYNGQSWTGEGGAAFTLNVSADGYTLASTTRLRPLAPVTVSTPSGGGTGSAVEVLAVVEIA